MPDIRMEPERALLSLELRNLQVDLEAVPQRIQEGSELYQFLRAISQNGVTLRSALLWTLEVNVYALGDVGGQQYRVMLWMRQD